MDYKHLEWVPEFDPRNHELSFLAAVAAIEIDLYQSNRGEHAKSVKHLSRLINEITQGENPRVIDNPEIYSVLFHAIPSEREKYEEYWQEYSKRKSRHVNEILLQTNLVAKDLRDFKILSKEKQEELGTFCVNLSRELSYFQETYYPIRHRLIA